MGWEVKCTGVGEGCSVYGSRGGGVQYTGVEEGSLILGSMGGELSIRRWGGGVHCSVYESRGGELITREMGRVAQCTGVGEGGAQYKGVREWSSVYGIRGVELSSVYGIREGEYGRGSCRS